MAVTGNFDPTTGTVSLAGDALNNTIGASRNAAGAILANGGAVAIQGGTPTIANTGRIEVLGADGDDVIALDETNGALPNATLHGGAGNDVAAGGSGADVIFGEDGDDILVGKGGLDLIAGGIGNDTLTGGDADDILSGEAGDDSFIWNPGDDNDELDGGTGFDRLVFAGAGIGENINISNDDGFGRLFRDVANVEILMSQVERIEFQARAGADVITVQDLTGSGITEVAIDLAGSPGGSVGDLTGDRVTLNGTNAANTVSIVSAGSAIVVSGLAAQVTIDHAEAIDDLEIKAFGGDDRIDASGLAAGFSLIVDAGAGNDTLTGSAGTDILLGGDGNDVITGGRDDDLAFLGEGSDTFVWNAGDGSDIVEGQGGLDHLNASGSTAGDRFTLTANGNRVLVAHDLSNATLDVDDVERIELLTSAGKDTVILNDLSGTDATRVVVDLGADGELDQVGINATAADEAISVTSIAGPVQVNGLAAAIVLSGTDAGDQVTINGGAGDDVINATTLSAGRMSVIMQGGAGADNLVGSAGIDTATYAASAAGVNVDLTQQEGFKGDAEGDTLSGIENLIGSSHNDVLNGTDGDNVLQGGAGSDDMKGLGGDDVLVGGIGDDEIHGNEGDDTAVFNVDFNTVKVSFEGDAVVIESAEGRDVLRGIEHFQFTDGTIDRNDGSPLVDDLFYFARNKDVWDAGVDAETHYNAVGWLEGRDPSATFSTNGYLSANADVRAAGVNPLQHFDQSGWREGRDPSANFDVQLYLERHPDVAAAGINPLAHFEASGRAEGREAFAAIGNVINGFDAEYYLLANPDVGFAGVDALFHFQVVGWKEGRDPNAWFDSDAYLAAYRDVMAAGVNPLDHYMAHGAREGRDPSAAFDTTDYLSANPDVAAAGVNPLQHFLQFGIHEGRSPFSDGLFS